MEKYLKNKFFISAIFLALVAVIMFGILLNTGDEVIADSSDIRIEEVIENSDDTFFVDVKGEVKKPGVYEVKNGMIVNDAIKLAGGVNSKANTNNINLSKELEKEMVIYVYSKNDVKKIVQKNDVPCKCEIVEINNCIKDDGKEVSDNKENNGKVNINTASKDELMTLSGIGESKADAIIEYRNKKRFESIEDIKNISGIGDAMFDKIKDYITV